MENTDPNFFYDLETASQNPDLVLKLDLHYQNLSTVPKEIAKFENLQELYL